MHGYDVLRLGGVLLDLLPQSGDVNINRSRRSLGDVRWMLRESDGAVYTVLTGPFLPRSNAGMVMDELASASGGKSYFPGNAEMMSETFEHIALELRRQYSIGYTPSNLVTDGKWRRVEVKVTPPPGFPRLVARNRKGYYAIGHALGGAVARRRCRRMRNAPIS
jgi:Ca-activated chloride channel family protein